MSLRKQGDITLSGVKVIGGIIFHLYISLTLFLEVLKNSQVLKLMLFYSLYISVYKTKFS